MGQDYQKGRVGKCNMLVVHEALQLDARIVRGKLVHWGINLHARDLVSSLDAQVTLAYVI